MASYYISMIAKPNGKYEVHRADCKYMPSPERRMYLGEFPDCLEAVNKARLAYHTATCCTVCSPDCHSC